MWSSLFATQCKVEVLVVKRVANINSSTYSLNIENKFIKIGLNEIFVENSMKYFNNSMTH